MSMPESLSTLPSVTRTRHVTGFPAQFVLMLSAGTVILQLPIAGQLRTLPAGDVYTHRPAHVFTQPSTSRLC